MCAQPAKTSVDMKVIKAADVGLQAYKPGASLSSEERVSEEAPPARVMPHTTPCTHTHTHTQKTALN